MPRVDGRDPDGLDPLPAQVLHGVLPEVAGNVLPNVPVRHARRAPAFRSPIAAARRHRVVPKPPKHPQSNRLSTLGVRLPSPHIFFPPSPLTNGVRLFRHILRVHVPPRHASVFVVQPVRHFVDGALLAERQICRGGSAQRVGRYPALAVFSLETIVRKILLAPFPNSGLVNALSARFSRKHVRFGIVVGQKQQVIEAVRGVEYGNVVRFHFVRFLLLPFASLTVTTIFLLGSGSGAFSAGLRRRSICPARGFSI